MHKNIQYTVSTRCTLYSRCASRGVYPPNGNDANFPLLPLSLSLPFPPQGLGAEPPVAGVRGYPRKKLKLK